MSGEPVIPPGSRAVLIGVPHYQDAKFSSYPAVGNSVEGMRGLLVESGLCGWREDQVITIVDPENSGQLLSRLRELARHTRGVLLLYFVGHGVLSEQGELCLAIADTDHANPDVTGLEYAKIKRMFYDGTPAAIRIAILDCCFSGRVIGLGPIGEGQLADLSQTSGAYTLTAADDFASSEGGLHTAFTGELLRLLARDGLPGGPPALTLGAIYPLLRRRLAAKALPLPNQRSDDSAAAFVFARNAAARTETIFQDDFSDSTRWTVGGQTDHFGRDHGKWGYANGQLQLLPKEGMGLWPSAPVGTEAMPDIRITVRGRIEHGNGGFGVWCRGGPDITVPRYAFYVYTVQLVSIVKDDGVGRNFVPKLLVNYAPALMIRPYSDNVVTAECRENGQTVELRLSVNGQLAATATDNTDIRSGDNVGITAATWSPNPDLPDVRISEFRVERLS